MMGTLTLTFPDVGPHLIPLMGYGASRTLTAAHPLYAAMVGQRERHG